MRYIRYILIILTHGLILLNRDLVYLILIKFRHKIRDVVYTYMYNNKIQVLDYTSIPKDISNKKPPSLTIYYLYSILWYFLDDRLDRDIIDISKIGQMCINEEIPFATLQKYVIKDIETNAGTQSLHANTYLQLTQERNIKFKWYTILCFILNHGKSNFYYKYFYTKDIKHTFYFRIKGYGFGYIMDLNYSSSYYKLVFFEKGDKDIYG